MTKTLAELQDIREEMSDSNVDLEEGETHLSVKEEEEEEEEEEREEIGKRLAQQGDAAVKMLRFGLFLALVAATTLASLSIYFYTRNAEQMEFKNAFDANSQRIIEAFDAVAERRMSAVAAFGTTITSYAMTTNATWPFVTIPNMEARARHVMTLAEAIAIAFAPIIYTPEDRETWENEYVPINMKWIEESREYVENVLQQTSYGPGLRVNPSTASNSAPPVYEGMPDFSVGYARQVYTTGMTPLGTIGPVLADMSEPAIPWWQSAPVPSEQEMPLTNLDLMDDPSFGGDLLQTLERRRAALGFMSIGGYFNYAAPISGFYYPIMERLEPESKVVGTLATLMFWDTFFENVLPPNVNGMVVVLRNTCNQTFTFQINGRAVASLGEGDMHDEKYDFLRQDVSFTASINEAYGSGSCLGAPMDEQGCQYSLSVYASKELEDAYVSIMPIVYTIGTILIFLLTSALFIMYDRLVERRQRMILEEAEKSGAIVSSLFPKAFRDRLMEAQEVEHGKPSAKKRLNTFMNSTQDHNSGAKMDNYDPIADQYDDCKVLFADIAGFTKWSSTRDPGQVFTLLQEVYGSFDRAAKKRGVFKVETIGDCYLAVTGLPKAQPDHAIIMAKFANDIIDKMHSVASSLEEKLGEGTSKLTLRIGLHSGPVTAGILKGEKSRFQLFGDTVNTASRMESNGEANRIQVSPQTAELLTKGGKGHWLCKRDGLTEMKGIGLVQTYWLVRSRTFSTTESSTSSGGTHTISFPTDPRPQCPRKMHSVREYLKEHLEN